MKLLLIGYPGSQKIRKATEYLIKKYLPFDITYLNYQGEIKDWSKAVSNLLKSIDDKYIILALDDYLLNAPINKAIFKRALQALGTYQNVKLCDCTGEEQEQYPVTTQYTIWDREILIEILGQTTTPWDFEMNGSRIFKEKGYKANKMPALSYYTNSSLSKRWEGVRLDGLNEEDINKVQELL